ncbi:hypothetical protein [Corynebacterium gerontici]|uniref:Fido domain-containing protein n=1 Tax=Corynebacterium gerontici TaxID=2079234 RepID=A0A3G6J3K9_9CORY|nr:hypothetical protein [Corynebacterium gerontici]AZA12283.1 hypothetical protein CGERO_09985 [Corynebacterium gerontici]
MALLEHLAQNPTVQPALERATNAIEAVHRRPVNLRKVAITSSESAVRGAKSASMLTGEDQSICLKAYSVLAPESVDTTARTLRRAPLQVLARIDVLAGGSGRPAEGKSEAAQSLAAVLSKQPHPGVIPAVAMAAIAGQEMFGQRSLLLGLVAARAAAIAFGFDPRGLCVPEPYYYRRQKQCAALVRDALDSTDAMANWIAFTCEAFEGGAKEAEGIAAVAAQTG